MIENTLAHYEKQITFENELGLGIVPNDVIAFIKDTGRVWTHGRYYTDYEEIKRILFQTGPGSLSDTIKNLRESILGSSVSEDFNTLSKIEKFLKENQTVIVEGEGITVTTNKDTKQTEIKVNVDKESIDLNTQNELKVKTVDGGLY